MAPLILLQLQQKEQDEPSQTERAADKSEAPLYHPFGYCEGNFNRYIDSRRRTTKKHAQKKSSSGQAGIKLMTTLAIDIIIDSPFILIPFKN